MAGEGRLSRLHGAARTAERKLQHVKLGVLSGEVAGSSREAHGETSVESSAGGRGRRGGLRLGAGLKKLGKLDRPRRKGVRSQHLRTVEHAAWGSSEVGGQSGRAQGELSARSGRDRSVIRPRSRLHHVAGVVAAAHGVFDL